MKTITLEQFKTHYYNKYPRSTLRLGQLFCLVFIDKDENWQKLYYETHFHQTNKLIWEYLLTKNIDFNRIPVLRQDLL